MHQERFRAFEGLLDPVTECGWVEFADGLTRIVRCHREEPNASDGGVGEDEADYCRGRAEVEAARADQATHPSARAAHLEMAALYHKRALAALQADDSATQDWMSEGGSWLAAA